MKLLQQLEIMPDNQKISISLHGVRTTKRPLFSGTVNDAKKTISIVLLDGEVTQIYGTCPGSIRIIVREGKNDGENT